MPYTQYVMSLATRTTKRGAHVPQYRYTAVFEPAVEGGYIVSVPALPGLVTEGDTIEEARVMVKDAIRGYIESLVKHGEEIPIESGTANVERVEITI
jgi:predicted RNase H-like HicB family nuclease